MKRFASVVKKGAPILIAAGVLISCSKERLNSDADQQQRIEISDKETQQMIVQQAEKMPRVGVYNTAMDKIIVLPTEYNEEKSYTFVDPPSGGFNWATSNGGQWATYPDEAGNIVVITDPGAGLGAGGGTVVVGSTTLNIAFAICFAVGDEALGQGLFDTGIDEVAGVVGIAGDLEALQTIDFEEDEDADLSNFFQGFAYYLVYAEDLANEDYEVLNWLEDLDQEEDELDGFGFAYVVHFVDGGGIFLSESGELSVDGGSIGFNGTYFGIEGLLFFDEEGEDEEFDFSEVPGFGTMGCE